MLRWGLIGFGRAGCARARAIQACERSELVAGLRGAVADFGLTPSPGVAALIERVDAVAICSPTDSHAAYAAQALQAGRHVVCEYPLAADRQGAQALFDLADRHQRVLHVEHIELLAATQQALATSLEATEVLGGRLIDRRGSPGPDPLDLLARLHRLVQLLGLADGVSPQALRFGTVAIELDVGLSGPGRPATRQLTLRTPRGVLALQGRQVTLDGQPVPLPATPGLFAQDHAVATARILDGAPSYVSRGRILNVLGLVDALSGSAWVSRPDHRS